jgi:hypothetical protein
MTNADVARAAAKFIVDGKNPNVDSVWQTLGNIGSRSTVAPFLKRRKAGQEDTGVTDVSVRTPWDNQRLFTM